MESLITIIIPVYNVECFLVRCLDSVIGQSYKNLEILVIDDGSTDSSGIICDKYAERDNRIKVIHKKNGGLSSARNVGLDSAHGEYVSFIDSDDFISSEFVEHLLQTIKKSEADIAFCDYTFYYSVEPTCERHQSGRDVLYIGKESIMKNFYNHNCGISVIACNKLYKRDLFENIRFPVGRLYEDEATTYIVFYSSKRVVYLKESLYYYFQRPGSITKDKLTEKNLSIFIALKEVIDFYLNHNENRLAQKARIRLMKISALYLYRAKKEGGLHFWKKAKEGIPKQFEDEYKNNLTIYKMTFLKGLFDIYGMMKNI